MKQLFMLGLALMLALAASASATEASAGPYSVSFELKTAAEPIVSVSGPIEGDQSSQYYLNIKTNNTTAAGIGITSYKDWQDASFPEAQAKEALMSALAKAGEISNPAIIERIIDGSKATMQSYTASLMSANVTMATYWKDSQAVEGYSRLAGKTKVEILSKLPKDLTENLLSTLSIKITSNENTSPVAANVISAVNESAQAAVAENTTSAAPVVAPGAPAINQSTQAAADELTEAVKEENITTTTARVYPTTNESEEPTAAENIISATPQADVASNASTETIKVKNITIVAPQEAQAPQASEVAQVVTPGNESSEIANNASTEGANAQNVTIVAPQEAQAPQASEVAQVVTPGNESSEIANNASTEGANAQNVTSAVLQVPVAGNESAEASGAENTTVNATVEDYKSAFVNKPMVKESMNNLVPETPHVSAAASNQSSEASDNQTIISGLNNTTIAEKTPDSTGLDDEKINETCMQQWVSLGYTGDMIKFMGYCTEEG